MSEDYAKLPSQGGRNNKLSSYVMNGSVCNFGNVLPPTTKLTAVWSPMCYLLWEPDENTLGPGIPAHLSKTTLATFHPRRPLAEKRIGSLHDKNGNILALDGHVDFMATNQFRTLSQNYGSGPDRRGLLWWATREPTAAADRPHFIAARSEGAFGPFVLLS